MINKTFLCGSKLVIKSRHGNAAIVNTELNKIAIVFPRSFRNCVVQLRISVSI